MIYSKERRRRRQQLRIYFMRYMYVYIFRYVRDLLFYYFIFLVIFTETVFWIFVGSSNFKAIVLVMFLFLR